MMSYYLYKPVAKGELELRKGPFATEEAAKKEATPNDVVLSELMFDVIDERIAS